LDTFSSARAKSNSPRGEDKSSATVGKHRQSRKISEMNEQAVPEGLESFVLAKRDAGKAFSSGTEINQS
jgi:hypothetical protein